MRLAGGCSRAQLYLPDGERIGSMKKLSSIAECIVDAPVIVGCGEPLAHRLGGLMLPGAPAGR